MIEAAVTKLAPAHIQETQVQKNLEKSGNTKVARMEKESMPHVSGKHFSPLDITAHFRRIPIEIANLWKIQKHNLYKNICKNIEINLYRYNCVTESIEIPPYKCICKNIKIQPFKYIQIMESNGKQLCKADKCPHTRMK